MGKKNDEVDGSAPKIVPTEEIGEHVPGENLLFEPAKSANDIGLMMFSFPASNPGKEAPGVPDHCLSAIMAGGVGGNYRLNNGVANKGVLRKGDVLFQSAGHSLEWNWEPLAESADNLLNFVITLSPSLLFQFAQDNFDYTIDAVDIPWQLSIDDPFIYQLAMQLKLNSQTSDNLSGMFRESSTQLLCVHLLKHYFEQRNVIRYKGGLSKRHIQVVNDYLVDNLAAETSIDDMAKLVGLSRFHFLRQFKTTTGQSPHQYKIGLIIRESKRLLLKTDKKITDISQELGYQNASRFAELFKRHVNVTPSEFRRMS